MPPASNRTARLLIVASIALYVLSLALPAFTCDADGADGVPRRAVPGGEALALGWFAAIFGVLGVFTGSTELLGTVTWIVNPMLLAAWILAWRARSAATWFSAAAFLVSLVFLAVHTIPVPDNQTMRHIVPGTGYGLWVLSTLAAIVAAVRARATEPVPLRTFTM